MLDTGVSPNGMVENMRRLGLSAAEVEVIVLSHGHWDHVTGMEGPSLLVRAHWTGWKAVHQLASRFPDAFVLSTVGTTIEL